MSRKTLHVFVLILIATLQAAQGAFSGAILCREESGEVVVEWSEEGGCDHSGFESATCTPTETEHCLGCVDTPLPSEIPAKSMAFTSEILWIPLTFFIEGILADPARPLNVHEAAPRRLAFEQLRSIRLLV